MVYGIHNVVSKLFTIHQCTSFKASLTCYTQSSVYHYHACTWTSPLSSFVIKLSNPDSFHHLPKNVSVLIATKYRYKIVVNALGLMAYVFSKNFQRFFY